MIPLVSAARKILSQLDVKEEKWSTVVCSESEIKNIQDVEGEYLVIIQTYDDVD